MCASLLFMRYCPPNPNQVEKVRLKKWIPVPVQVVKSGQILLYRRGCEKKVGTYGQSLSCK